MKTDEHHKHCLHPSANVPILRRPSTASISIASQIWQLLSRTPSLIGQDHDRSSSAPIAAILSNGVYHLHLDAQLRHAHRRRSISRLARSAKFSVNTEIILSCSVEKLNIKLDLWKVGSPRTGCRALMGSLVWIFPLHDQAFAPLCRFQSRPVLEEFFYAKSHSSIVVQFFFFF